jgi:hypothetical protein
MKVDVCAKKIISGIKSNKKTVIIGQAGDFLWLWWFVPSLYYKIAHSKGLQNNLSSICINFLSEFNKSE